MDTKRCTKCGEIKTADCFGRRGKSLRSWCKACMAARDKEYYAANQEKEAARHKKYRNENKEKVAARHKRYIDEISPSYVKSLLAASLGIDKKDITPQLIELKTKQIKLTRLIKETYHKNSRSDKGTAD